MNLNALREQRAEKVEAMTALVNSASQEKRDLSADEQTSFDSLKSEERTLTKQIERAEYVADAEKRTKTTPVTGTTDKHEDLANKVSVLKVMQAQMGHRSLDGAELEYSQEAERRTGRKAEGAFIPMTALEKRVNTTSSADDLVPTTHRADQYIGPLRNSLLARRLGVRVLSGLQGNVSIPKYGTGLTTGWIAENSNVPDGNMTFDEVTLSPKHVGGKTEMSRQLIQQSSPAIESLVRDDLSYLIAQQLDSAVINGSGSSNEPLGIMQHANIQTGTLATPSWEEVLTMIEQFELENLTAGVWLTSPSVKRALGSTLKESGIAGYLLENGRMADLPLNSTNQVPEVDSNGGNLLLGDFSQVMLGIWSEIDILVNPYAEPAYTRGGVLVRAMATADVALRHPEGFVLADDVSI